MIQLRNISQDELKYVYESAQAQMEYNPKITAKYKKLIEQQPFYKCKEEAINAAEIICTRPRAMACQIWAKIGVDGEYYYIQDYYIVSDDIRISIAADYIGMAQMYYG